MCSFSLILYHYQPLNLVITYFKYFRLPLVTIRLTWHTHFFIESSIFKNSLPPFSFKSKWSYSYLIPEWTSLRFNKSICTQPVVEQLFALPKVIHILTILICNVHLLRWICLIKVFQFVYIACQPYSRIQQHVRERTESLMFFMRWSYNIIFFFSSFFLSLYWHKIQYILSPLPHTIKLQVSIDLN